MAHLSDLELDKDSATPAPQRRAVWRPVLLTALLIALAAAVVTLIVTFWRASPSNVRLRTEQAVVPGAGGAEPGAEAGEDIALAPLDETDPLVRELVAQLSSHPKVAAWLATDQLIRNFTVTVVNISMGQSPVKHLQRLTPSGAFRTSTTGTISYIDPRSYQRYDDYADAVSALDARGAARLYATLKPRIQDAASELGEPDGDFDATMERAIIELLSTPVIEGSVAVIRTSVNSTYADSRLESLSSAQRQLLRTGPRNVQLIQSKLREIAPYLGIAADKLPESTVIRFPQAR